jgi:hypothetical protein
VDEEADGHVQRVRLADQASRSIGCYCYCQHNGPSGTHAYVSGCQSIGESNECTVEFNELFRCLCCCMLMCSTLQRSRGGFTTCEKLTMVSDLQFLAFSHCQEIIPTLINPRLTGTGRSQRLDFRWRVNFDAVGKPLWTSVNCRSTDVLCHLVLSFLSQVPQVFLKM